jgi:hypothetical protein
MVFGYTNERTFTDIMENRFGKFRVAKINFSKWLWVILVTKTSNLLFLFLK